MSKRINKMGVVKIKKTPKKIVFICNQLEINIMRGLLEAVNNDKRFDITVIATECLGTTFSPHISQEKIASRLRSANIQYTKDDDVELENFRDAIFLTSLPYDIYLPDRFKSSELIKYGKLVNLMYGVRLVKDVGIYAMPPGSNPYLERCTYVFVDEKISAPNIKYKSVGSAKAYFYREHYLVRENNSLNKDVLSIAWKPRWTQAKDSNLFPLLEYFNRFLSENQSVELVLVEHPLLRSKLSEVGTLRKFEAWEAEVQKIAKYTSVSSDEGLERCLQADILIADISSTMYEFSFTGRPIIYTTDNLPLNKVGIKLAQVCYSSSNPRSIFWVLKNLVNGIDPLSKKRLKYKKKKIRKLNNPYTKILSTLNQID